MYFRKYILSQTEKPDFSDLCHNYEYYIWMEKGDWIFENNCPITYLFEHLVKLEWLKLLVWHTLHLQFFDVNFAFKNISSGVCEKQKGPPACASAQSDQHLCYSLIGKFHITPLFAFCKGDTSCMRNKD